MTAGCACKCPQGLQAVSASEALLDAGMHPSRRTSCVTASALAGATARGLSVSKAGCAKAAGLDASNPNKPTAPVVSGRRGFATCSPESPARRSNLSAQSSCPAQAGTLSETAQIYPAFLGAVPRPSTGAAGRFPLRGRGWTRALLVAVLYWNLVSLGHAFFRLQIRKLTPRLLLATGLARGEPAETPPALRRARARARQARKLAHQRHGVLVPISRTLAQQVAPHFEDECTLRHHQAAVLSVDGPRASMFPVAQGCAVLPYVRQTYRFLWYSKDSVAHVIEPFDALAC